MENRETQIKLKNDVQAKCADLDYRALLPMGVDGDFTRKEGDFRVFDRSLCQFKTPYRRRDFYKITLILNRGLLHYADKVIEVKPPTLLFSNPLIPYCWEAQPGEQLGHYCVFTADFLVRNSPGGVIPDLFTKKQTRPVYYLDKQASEKISWIFRQMDQESMSDYSQKEALIYSYVQILIHEARKLKVVEQPHTVNHTSHAAARITALFMEMLDRQFPVDIREGPQLKKAADYAEHLSIHVNHLNRALKEVTGKTTSEWLTERLIQQAQQLLLQTDLNISEIGYALGFEYPSYFNQFFRKVTGRTPASYRVTA